MNWQREVKSKEEKKGRQFQVKRSLLNGGAVSLTHLSKVLPHYQRNANKTL